MSPITPPPSTSISARRALDGSLVRGIAWTGGVRWSAQLIGWSSTFVVARLLSPEDYGLVGFATVYLSLMALLSEFGIGEAIVSFKDIDDSTVAEMNTLAVMLGIAALLISCLAAAPLSWFFQAPELIAVISTLSLNFVLTACRTVPYSQMQKRLEFRKVALIDGVQSIALAGATLAFALAGFRYWSLVLGSLVGGALGTTFMIASARLSYRWPRFSALRRMLTFSSQLLIARVAWYFFSDSDFLVAGKMLGKVALGTYTLAWNLAYVPMEKITTLVTGVALSVLSVAQDSLDELRRYTLLITEGLALVTFPTTIGLALVADDFVPLVVGEQWRPAIWPLRMLCISAGFRSVTPVLSQALTVLKDNRYTMWRMIAAAIILPASFAIAARWGIRGLASAWLIVYPIFVALPLWLRSFRLLKLGTLRYLDALRPATEGCLVMAGIVLSARAILFENLPPIARIALMITLGALSYGLVLLLRWRSRLDTFRTAWQLLRR